MYDKFRVLGYVLGYVGKRPAKWAFLVRILLAQ